MSPGPPWWAADPQQQWPANLADEFQAKLWDGCEMGGTWEAMYSDRRTELVCIGRELDHEAASAQLEACLITTDEMAAGAKSWLALSDPWPDPFANPFAKDGTLRDGIKDQGSVDRAERLFVDGVIVALLIFVGAAMYACVAVADFS